MSFWMFFAYLTMSQFVWWAVWLVGAMVWGLLQPDEPHDDPVPRLARLALKPDRLARERAEREGRA